MNVLDTFKTPSMEEIVCCKVCGEPFSTIQDCLAHELLKHSVNPQKKIRKNLEAISKVFASNQTQCERRELQSLLNNAQLGQHLRIVIGFYAGNCTELATSFSQVREALQSLLPNPVKVYPFGSLVTGLSMKDSDIDLYLEQVDTSSNCMTHRQFFNRVYKILRSSECFREVFGIRHARVPIIRCKHIPTDISLDINTSSPKSTHNSRFFSELLNRDIRLRELFLFLKIWTKKLKIIGHGSMSSYCLMTLIIFGMQQQRQLPSIKVMQSRCPVREVMGVNFGYSLQYLRPLPARITTVDLLCDFFNMYSTIDFENKLLSPYLGCELDANATFSVAGSFPDYEAQLVAMERATGECPEPFKFNRCVCVQDPFELQHNVAQSILPWNLAYLRNCLILASQACWDKNLTSNPAKFYDYLLFGLAEKLWHHQRQDQEFPAKPQRKQLRINQESANVETITTTQTIATVAARSITEAASSTAEAARPTIEAASSTTEAASPTSEAASPTSEAVSSTSDAASPTSEGASSSADAACPTAGFACPPQRHVYTIVPTNNDLKSLRAELLSNKLVTENTINIYHYWAKYNLETIKDLMINIYAIKMKLIESDKPVRPKHALPRHLIWHINTTVDTWTARNFQRATNQSFFAKQLQQTVEFLNTRSEDVVHLSGIFTLNIAADNKEMQLEVQPMPGDVFGLHRQGPLNKFFKSLKNMCAYYNFKEKLISLQYSAKNGKRQSEIN